MARVHREQVAAVTSDGGVTVILPTQSGLGDAPIDHRVDGHLELPFIPMAADATIRGMRLDVEIERLVWDAWNREHILKHKVTVEQGEEAVARRRIRQDTYKGRQQLFGATANGRILSVIIGPVPQHRGVFYVFSARPATSGERRRYAQVGEGDDT